MAKLKLGAIADDKPVRLTIELPATVHRELVAYSNALARETGQGVVEPVKADRPDADALYVDRPRFREIAAHGIGGAATKIVRNLVQKRRRKRASSRMKATNRPTTGSSASGLQTSST